MGGNLKRKNLENNKKFKYLEFERARIWAVI
jgi:hypothetical protein